MLLIALSLNDEFRLPAEDMPDWYGISADTASPRTQRPHRPRPPRYQKALTRLLRYVLSGTPPTTSTPSNNHSDPRAEPKRDDNDEPRSPRHPDPHRHHRRDRRNRNPSRAAVSPMSSQALSSSTPNQPARAFQQLTANRKRPFHWRKEGPTLREAAVNLLENHTGATYLLAQPAGRRQQITARRELLAYLIAELTNDGIRPPHHRITRHSPRRSRPQHDPGLVPSRQHRPYIHLRMAHQDRTTPAVPRRARRHSPRIPRRWTNTPLPASPESKNRHRGPLRGQQTTTQKCVNPGSRPRRP